MSVSILVTLTLLATVLPGRRAEGQLTCTTTCTGTIGMTCSVTANCPLGYGAYVTPSASITTAINANCTLGTYLNAMAMHTPAQGTPATCGFMFEAICCQSSNCFRVLTETATCVVTAANGLPVELMDFSIEHAKAGSPEATDERGGEG